MPDERRRPGELVLAAAVARRYYLHGQSKVEIADALGVSRFKVARLIDYARESGIVRIEIVTESGIDLDRSTRLQEVFGLRHAVVVTGRSFKERVASLGSAPVSPLESPLESPLGSALAGSASLAQLGAAAAELLGEVLAEGDVLGLPWSRSVDVMTRSLRDLPRVDVVQLTGALEVPGYDSSTVASVRRAARVSGGRSAIFYAPFLLDDASSAAALRREPQVARVLAQASRVTVAVVGIGAWQGGLSTIFDAACSVDRDAAAAAGVVGEIGGILFDAAGTIVECSLSERLVTISAQDLHAIREVVAIAAGAARRAAVRAAVAGGLVNALVVDLDLADALLGAAPEAPRPAVEPTPRISRADTKDQSSGHR